MRPLALLAWAGLLLQSAAPSPVTPEEQSRLHRSLDERIRSLSETVREHPGEADARSRRGDALFMRGRFKEAVDDYEQMVLIDPSLGPGHWRRGIAYFFAGQYEKAAGQFEAYRTQDDVDRENGIWRYFSQLKAYGKERARSGLLKYAKDDREPFPDVYQLFEGKREPSAILEKIERAPLEEEARRMRLFYAHLYIGLDCAVEGRSDDAIPHLRKAVENPWPRGAGYGPDFMWHVGRLEYEILTAPRSK